ncbi:two-component system, OmpR family, sensor histidine kinase VanS [Paenibacillus sophorae]|uniref:histidine kinase n=1 Tax=Paenibacillus sophorae TaxID=1333845 RepID=A0A1H8V9B5_9BACL|nr:HAMP domain-containing sensor histidine kinase [Paenibacillus sophorae]QWU13240.1 HAMP domain-containing histidine kinase [Paenibacillus sophorae]SEP11883.1 two-component system, OmpR family, sensor histidine kinase VanS [Paenibacillus sophorae]
MNEKQIKKRITKRMLQRFLISLLISFTLIFGAALFFIWFYPYLPFSNYNLFKLGFIAFAASPFLIVCIQWKQLISYLSSLAARLESIDNPDTQKIVLPSVLKEAEDQINQIKSSIKEKDNIARQAEQRKNDLVVYLAHDLKTPISSIIGYLTLLRDEKQISHEMHDRYIQVTLKNAERLDELINEFFDITRFNLAHVSLNYSTVHLNRMLEQMLFEFHPLLSGKNLTYRLDLPSEIELTCDVDKMQRVFDNLLRNAVYYSFDHSEIQIHANLSDSTVKLYFMNSGYTIPPEKLGRIFEQFYRLDSSRSTQYGGAGLGLAIAKQIVELHHGRISASSSDNQICFSIELPRSQENRKKSRIEK